MEFVKKFAYIVLGAVCVLVLGGLFLLTNSRPAGIVDAGRPIVPPVEVEAQEVEELPGPGEEEMVQESTSDVMPNPTPVSEPEMLMVHIVGAVRYPGVFEVLAGARIIDVLRLAGGYSDDANQGQINLSAFVEDAMQIRIPAVGEEIVDPTTPSGPSQAADSGPQTQTEGRININLASLAELQTLQGIGPVIAQNIIDHRERHGDFATIDELMNVSRIGAVTFENIRDRVTVD